MQNSKLVMSLVAVAMLSACEQGVTTAGNSNRQNQAGTAGGTVLNGGEITPLTNPPPLATPAAPAPLGGALLGNMLNGSVGKSLDNNDKAEYDATAQHALETGQIGQTMAWRNPQSGHSGTVTPQNYSQNSTGQYCRDYSQTIVAGAQKEDGYGKACRTPDGIWQIIQ